ncbi:MAG: hypothetical protein V1799_07825 [bacterium]
MGRKRSGEQDDMFGGSRAVKAGEEEFTDMTETTGQDDKKGSKDCVSAWIKALRLGRLQDSMYWLNVMSNTMNNYYIAMRMAVFAGEDCWDDRAMNLTASLLIMTEKNVPDIWNHFYFVNAYLCRCTKGWEDPLGVEVIRELLNVEKRCVMDSNKKIVPEPIPSWAVDFHTSLGNQFRAEGRWELIDRRFGGEMVGILTRVLMFKKHGKIDPELGMEEFWEAHNLLKKMKEKKPADE